MVGHEGKNNKQYMFHTLGQVSKEKLYFLVSKQLTMLFTDCLAQSEKREKLMMR